MYGDRKRGREDIGGYKYGDKDSRKRDKKDSDGDEKEINSRWQLVTQDLEGQAKQYGCTRNLSIGIPVCTVKIANPLPTRQDRALDSLARLVETHAGVCSAIAYDPQEKKLLFSTNGKDPEHTVEKVLLTLKHITESKEESSEEKFTSIIQGLCVNNNTNIAKLLRNSITSVTAKRITNIENMIIATQDKELQNNIENFYKAIKELQEKLRNNRNSNNSAFELYNMCKDACDSIRKIIEKEEQSGDNIPSELREIIDDFRGPIEDLHKVARALLDPLNRADWANSVEQGQYKEVLSNRGIHAEANIMAYFIDRLIGKEEQGKQYIYIGVSKLCCVDCENAVVSACNFDFSNEEGGEKRISFAVRGGHGYKYSNPAPSYVTHNEKFLEELKRNLKEMARGREISKDYIKSTNNKELPRANRSPSTGRPPD
jgi:hypothetical protein